MDSRSKNVETTYHISCIDFVLGHDIGIIVCKSEVSVMIEQIVQNILEFIRVASLGKCSITQLLYDLSKKKNRSLKTMLVIIWTSLQNKITICPFRIELQVANYQNNQFLFFIARPLKNAILKKTKQNRFIQSLQLSRNNYNILIFIKLI